MIRELRWIEMDKFRRKLFIKYEIRNILYKSVMKNEYNSYLIRYHALFKKSHFTRFASKIEHNNRCVITGRNHNVIKKTQYSRFVFRTHSYIGNMPGCRKATW